MRRTHSRPSKDYVCGRCKRRIRWMPQVHRGGGKKQLIWCERCWRAATDSADGPKVKDESIDLGHVVRKRDRRPPPESVLLTAGGSVGA